MRFRVKKTSYFEFSSELLVFFLLLGQGRVSATSEDGSCLGNAKFMLAFSTSEHVGVDAEVAGGFADPFGLGEFERPKPVSASSP